MAVTALVLWVLTALGGASMAARWLTAGGAQRTLPAPEAPGAVAAAASRTRLTPALVFGHAALAGTGLVVWVAYVVSGAGPLAWLALALLLVVIGAGEVMFLRWFGGRAGAEPTIESRFPVPLVFGHGLAGLATIVFVLLAALRVGS